MQYVEKININASAEDVFSVYKNVADWPSWDHDVLTSQLNGEFEVGTKGELKPKEGPKTKMELIEVTPNQSFTVECKLPLCKMHFVHELKPDGQSTEVTNKIIFSGLLTPVFGRIIGREIQKTLPSSLQGLKQHLEA